MYERDESRFIRTDLVAAVREILSLLDQAEHPSDLDLPGYRLHPLQGDRAGEWAVTVRANWRIVFRMTGRDVVDVDLIDYH
jgi:toxin HigB-1